MENDKSQEQTTPAAEPDQAILSEERKDGEHVYEQQISNSSVSNEKDNHVYEKKIVTSGDDSTTNVSNEPLPEETKKPDENTQVTGEQKEGQEETEDTAAVGDYEEYRHESPAEIRKHQLEDLNPDHTAAILIRSMHGAPLPEYPIERPESYMWLSLFTLIFFSRIFGAFALYKSIKVRLLFAEGRIKESERASEHAKKLNLAGMIFCVCWVILIVVLFKSSGVFD